MDNSSFLSIGTNSGNRIENIKFLFKEFEKNNINIIDVSSVYESEPFKSLCQNNFYNLVIKVKTNYDLLDFFNLTNLIEKKMGRIIKNNPNIPRIIDIDILVFNNIVYSSKSLIIPHPKIHERKFVLLPWSEISGKYILPKYNKSVNYLLINVKDSSKICKLNNSL
tara:strand:- start:211 stop:708 length:498 start_codon:yes stop_codon:yes gene_type:complete